MISETEFTKELKDLINKHCVENASSTPDWILAQYMDSCLLAFDTAIQQRETWYGRDSRPLGPGPQVIKTIDESTLKAQ